MEKAKNYYGFEFDDKKDTTCGDPNPRTWRMSIAGELRVFTAKKELESWLSEGYAKKVRESVTKKGARELHQGMSSDEFSEMLKNMV